MIDAQTWQKAQPPAEIRWVDRPAGEELCSSFDTCFGQFLVASIEQCIVRCTLVRTSQSEQDRLRFFGTQHAAAHSSSQDDIGQSHELTPAMGNWLAGAATRLKIAARGTAFQQKVWRGLMQIPRGHVMGYGELAKALGKPKATRAVAAACGANPIPWIIPCHRVVAATGDLHGFGLGLELKDRMLRHEFLMN
jgi:O-6-methylguanine DNA methyltransferase